MKHGMWYIDLVSFFFNKINTNPVWALNQKIRPPVLNVLYVIEVAVSIDDNAQKWYDIFHKSYLLIYTAWEDWAPRPFTARLWYQGRCVESWYFSGMSLWFLYEWFFFHTLYYMILLSLVCWKNEVCVAHVNIYSALRYGHHRYMKENPSNISLLVIW